MLIVVGLGGNALLRRDDRTDWTTQRNRADNAAEAIRPLAAGAHLVVTHGNGPQVGLLALEQYTARHDSADPLDALDALTEGGLGYLLDQALTNAMPERRVATLLTQVVVDPDDPAFAEPTKPIGPTYTDAQRHTFESMRGWRFCKVPGGWRRVVASPEPQTIIEIDAIRLLIEGDHIVVCAGGGGIPVHRDAGGWLRGTEAVIDKDLTTARLAIALDAQALVLLTDVDSVQTGFGTAGARRLRRISVPAARSLDLPAGSMGTKVEAACRFASATGRQAGIGALDHAAQVLTGAAGTHVTADDVATRWWDPD